jgi:[acyl-carrier-protein] S-malonyltransferase
LEITNQNSPHAFVVSGIAVDVRKLTDLATEEGALHARLLGVSVPYHAPFLEHAAFGFADSVAGISIKAPSTPIVSLINSAVLSDADSLRTELCANLYHPLNWYQTMRFLLDAGISGFVECGPSRGLVRNSKFIAGNFRFFSLSNIIPSHPASGVS